MANIAEIVNYDDTFPVNLKVKSLDKKGRMVAKDIGVTMWITSFDAPEVQRIDQVNRASIMMTRIQKSGVDLDITADDVMALENKSQIEK